MPEMSFFFFLVSDNFIAVHVYMQNWILFILHETPEPFKIYFQ